MADVSQSFKEWMAANDAFLNPKINFFQPLDGGDRGVVATQQMDADTELVRVPLHLCIHMPTDVEWASHKAGALKLDSATVFLRGQPITPFAATTLLLMHHMSKVWQGARKWV
jgi:hypothetical protein